MILFAICGGIMGFLLIILLLLLCKIGIKENLLKEVIKKMIVIAILLVLGSIDILILYPALCISDKALCDKGKLNIHNHTIKLGKVNKRL